MSRLPKGGSHSSRAGKILKERGNDENEGAMWLGQKKEDGRRKLKRKLSQGCFEKKKKCKQPSDYKSEPLTRWATSEHFHLDAGYPYSKTVPSLPPSRPLKAFDPVNIITGESVRAGRQRDSTMRENCWEKDESSRYGPRFGAKVMLMFSKPLPTLTRRWRLLSLLIYFTWHLWHHTNNWGSAWFSRKPFLLEKPLHSSVDCLIKQVRNLHRLQKKPQVETLQKEAALLTAGQDFNSFSTFCLSHGDYLRQKVEISVRGLSLTTSDLISSFKTFDESIRTMWFITMGLKRISDEFPSLSDTF